MEEGMSNVSRCLIQRRPEMRGELRRQMLGNICAFFDHFHESLRCKLNAFAVRPVALLASANFVFVTRWLVCTLRMRRWISLCRVKRVKYSSLRFHFQGASLTATLAEALCATGR
jgi:hypothetical protein